MEKEISCRVIKTYYDYVVKYKGKEAADALLINLPYLGNEPQEKKALLDVHSWVSYKPLFFEFLSRIEKLFGDEAVYEIQMDAAKTKSYGIFYTLLRFVFPKPSVIFRQLPKFSKSFNRMSIIEFVKENKNSAMIRSRNIDKYFPTDKFNCDAARGAIAGLVVMLGYGFRGIEEPECSVPIDQKGMINGKYYRVNDKKEVVEYNKKDKTGKIIGNLEKDGTFRLGNTVYGAKDCLYCVTWKNKSIWERTFGQFFKMQALLRDAIDQLEKDKIIIDQKYRELEELNAGLEGKIKERTADLAHSNKIKDLFISIMEHDIKNNLTVIFGYSSLIFGHSGAAEQKNIRTIEENAKKINDLISNARTLSKIEDGGIFKMSTRQDLSQILEGAISELKIQAEQNKITIINMVPRDRFYFNAHTMFSDILLNLISNAIKYSNQRSKIEVYADDQKDKFIFCVKDYGKGVPDQYKEMIFKRYERMEIHSKEGVEGSGLGLAIVKALVELHQGRVWVEDNPSGGAIFKVELNKN